MDIINRFSLTLLCLFCALTGYSQNQRMTSLFTLQGFTNNGITRLGSVTAGVTTFGLSNYFSMVPGTHPATNLAPVWRAGSVGTLDDTRAERDQYDNIIRQLRYGGIDAYYLTDGGWVKAATIDTKGIDDGTAADQARTAIASTSGGVQAVGFRFFQWDADLDFVNNTYAMEAFSDAVGGGGWVVRTTNDVAGTGLPGFIFGGPHWVTLLQGGPVILAGSNLVAQASLSTSPVSVSLTADNQTVSTTNRSHIRLSSDNVTAANRTFVLTPGNQSGQIIVIEWVGTNAGEIADDSVNIGGGNNRLSAIWTPTQYDTLNLKFNGTDWVERGRSAN